ncbi:MAG TPA: flagellar motor switch protein FliM [Rhizobiales bacterium]|nr:flagellar motor switch protein FliM [Hyphomicrobiales bacterium]
MANAVSPADARAYILERLVGETGEPDKVVEAGRKLGKRTVAELDERLNRHFSFPLEFEMGRIEIARMAQALSQSAENHAVTVAASQSSPDALLLDMDGDCVSLLVGAFLGADPDLPLVPIGRPLSEIELEMMTTVFQEIAEAADGPSASLKLRSPVQKAFTGPDIAKHILRDGPAIRIPIVIRSPKSSGRVVMTLPQRVLLQSLGSADGSAQHGSEWSERLGEEVRRSTVTLDAVVPLQPMSLGALAKLRVGQILEMPETARSTTRLASRNKALFVCEFGKLGQNFSVRIKHPVDENKDMMDGLLAR